MSTTQAAVLSPTAKAELAIGIVLVLLFLWAREDLAAWWYRVHGIAPASVQTSTPEGCAPPATEHEQLHMVLAWRDGRVVLGGCLYVGSQSAYIKPSRKSANAHADR